MARNHTGFWWQREAAGSGMDSLTASPHWSRKFGKLHGNLISAAALCSPTETRPGAGRHMCDGLSTDTRWPVSEADRGKSLLMLRLSELEKELWPQGLCCFSQYRLCTSWGGIICGDGPGLFHFPSLLSFSLPSKALLSCSCQATELFKLKGQRYLFEIAAFAPSSLLFSWAGFCCLRHTGQCSAMTTK